MAEGDNDFRIRPGRIRQTRAQRTKPFVAQVLRATRRAGHVAGPLPTKPSALRAGGSTFGRGRLAFSHSRLFANQRRVAVITRIARHQGRAYRSAPLATHLAYLKRDGVTRDGERAVMFDSDSDRADDRAFAERCKDDRHHFRLIVSPEDAGEMTDLRAFTRDLAGRMTSDLGTRLDWIAVDHWNTDNPHVHMLVRGVDASGADLVISRDYLTRGLRERAAELVGIELGPKPEHQIRSALERDVTAERWTRLDVEVRALADETGWIDLRPGPDPAADLPSRRLMTGRLQHLERMGLATPVGAGEWVVGLDAERRLRDLGERGDIIKTMHRAFAQRGEDRSVADFAIGQGDAVIVGRLVEKGQHNELTGEAYTIIDGVDGRVHHIRFSGLDAVAHAPAPGGIVEIRRFGQTDDPAPTLVLATRSDHDLASQVKAPGATWLDHRLVERDPAPLAMGGFGRDVREALGARAEHLVEQGLASRQSGRVILQRDLLATLRRREMETVTARLSAETGLPHVRAAAGERVDGIYRQRLNLTSGRFAMIDNGLGFQLVPWSREIEQRLGRNVTGTAKDGGGIAWSLGRKQGLSL